MDLASGRTEASGVRWAAHGNFPNPPPPPQEAPNQTCVLAAQIEVPKLCNAKQMTFTGGLLLCCFHSNRGSESVVAQWWSLKLIVSPFPGLADICHHTCLSGFPGEQAFKKERNCLTPPDVFLFVYRPGQRFQVKNCHVQQQRRKRCEGASSGPLPDRGPLQVIQWSEQLPYLLSIFCRHHRAAQWIILILD